MADIDDEVKRVFSTEFKAELQERTAECDQLAAAKLGLLEENTRLRNEVERLKALREADAGILRDERKRSDELRGAVDGVLSDLECAELKCWCFTRAAMYQRPACSCANCSVWRRLSAVLAKVKP